MDDYSTKIKLSAEHLIRVEFPEKALELDTLVSVRILHACVSPCDVCLSLQSQVLSFSEVSKVRAEIRLPTADDLVAHSNSIGSGDVSDHSQRALDDRRWALSSVGSSQLQLGVE